MLREGGEDLSFQGDLSGAADAFAETRRIVENLVEADPGNAGWQRDLAVNSYKLALLVQEQEDPSGCIENLQSCFTVLDQMKRHGLPFDPQMVQVYHDLGAMFHADSH